MTTPARHTDGLAPSDALALDALIDGSLDPHNVPAHLQERAGAIASLLARLDVDRDRANDATLVNVTLARIARVPMPQALDTEALDALADAGWDASLVPAPLSGRAAEVARTLAVLEDSSAPSRSAAERAALVEATLARVQQTIEREENRWGVDRADRFRFGSFRLADLVSVAAVLVLGLFVLWPTAARWRDQARLQACASNMANSAVGFSLYAQDHNGALPMATAGFASGSPWWNVGAPGESHSANLFSLVSEGYAPLHDLTCPGNTDAVIHLNTKQFTDWRNPREVSYSYQLPTPALKWDGPVRLIVLTDKSPVIDRARRGELVDPLARSVNHRGAGQWALINDGSAAFLTTPVLPNGDNIWLPRSRQASSHPLLRGSEVPEGEDDAFVAP